MVGDYEYRTATLDDIDSLVHLWCKSAQFHEEIESRFKYSSDLDKWTAEYFTKQLPKDSFRIFTASDGTKIVGFVEAQVMKKPPIHAQRKVGYIGSMFVNRQHRRRGVGSHLWGLAHDWLKKQNVTKFQLAVAIKNPDGTNFWKRLGFEEIMFQMERKAD